MALKVEDLEDQTKYRQILAVHYSDLVNFVLEYLRRKSGTMWLFWSACIIFLSIAITVRFNIAGYYPIRNIMLHTILGLIVLPIFSIPVHELMHIVPMYLAGARDIRAGMDMKQFIFYVTAHRYVVKTRQFRLIALVPFLSATIVLLLLIVVLPGLWKWSLSLFLFVHTTMCAGDFALLNFYHINRKKKIYTWDDADEKMAYFYEEIY